MPWTSRSRAIYVFQTDEPLPVAAAKANVGDGGKGAVASAKYIDLVNPPPQFLATDLQPCANPKRERQDDKRGYSDENRLAGTTSSN